MDRPAVNVTDGGVDFPQKENKNQDPAGMSSAAKLVRALRVGDVLHGPGEAFGLLLGWGGHVSWSWIIGILDRVAKPTTMSP